MKTEKEIKAQIRFLKNAVLPTVESHEEATAARNQIEALKWVLREGD